MAAFYTFFACAVARFCLCGGNTSPVRWQEFANAMAKLCQAMKKSWQNADHLGATQAAVCSFHKGTFSDHTYDKKQRHPIKRPLKRKTQEIHPQRAGKKKALSIPGGDSLLSLVSLFPFYTSAFRAAVADNERKSAPLGSWNTRRSNSPIMASTWSNTSACTPS